MDDKTKNAIIAGAIANIPELIAIARQMMDLAYNMGEAAGMTPEQIDEEWQAVRNRGFSQDPDDLPDAYA